MKSHITLYLFFLLLLASCAQQLAPTGGARDTTPPVILKQSPENRSVKFNSKKIVIKFDEYITLNNNGDQIIISPPIEQKPVYTLKGKSLEIQLKSELRPNTTYTINFGNAIGDNKENNLLSGFTYVFSTGDALDSNFFAGEIKNAFTNKAEKDISIGVYPIDSFTDSTIYKKVPAYFIKSLDNGYFRIENLPAQSYRMVAYKDANKNLKYDKNEELAYVSQTLSAKDSANRNLSLKLFKPDEYPSGKIIDTFNRESGKYAFVVYKQPYFKVTSPRTDSVYSKLIKSVGLADTFYVFVPINNDTASTFYTAGSEQPIIIQHKKKTKLPAFQLQTIKAPELNDTITLSFSNPVATIDTSRIQLKQDSIIIPYSWYKQDPFTIRIYHPWKEQTRYALSVADSACRDIYNQYNKKEKLGFFSKSAKDYASLLLHIRSSHTVNYPYIIQLTDIDEKTVYKSFSVTKPQDITLDFLIAGTYRVKMIHDVNSNGVWDNGDYFSGTQPEKVDYFTDNLQLKAYWDIEQTIYLPQ